MKKKSEKELVKTLLTFLLVVGLFSLACDTGPHNEVDGQPPGQTTPDPVDDTPTDNNPVDNQGGENHPVDHEGLDYCETVRCWTACEDFDCVDTCLDLATEEALAQDIAFDLCLESCEHHDDDDDWAACIVETCPDDLALYDACFQDSEEPTDDSDICSLYYCIEYHCTDDEACAAACEENADDEALAEYNAYMNCLSDCDGAQDYWICVGDTCPDEDARYFECFYDDVYEPYTCRGHLECLDSCAEYGDDCVATCDNSECAESCTDSIDHCYYGCSELFDESAALLDDLYACFNAHCPEALEDSEAARACIADLCSEAHTACWND